MSLTKKKNAVLAVESKVVDIPTDEEVSEAAETSESDPVDPVANPATKEGLIKITVSCGVVKHLSNITLARRLIRSDSF